MDLDKRDMESSWLEFLAIPEMANWTMGMQDKWKDKLSKNRPALCKGIDPEPNLFSHLESLRIFNKRTCTTCANQTGKYSQVSMILDSLNKRPYEDFIKFCKALVYINQQHIVRNYLSLGDTSPSVPACCDPCDKLTESDAVPSNIPVDVSASFSIQGIIPTGWKDLIRNNYPALSEKIDPDHGLLDHLTSRGIIPDYLLDTYTGIQGKTNRVNAILDHLIMKRPNEDFVRFCECLNLTGQKWIIQELLSLEKPPCKFVTPNLGFQQKNDVTDEASGITTVPVFHDWKKTLRKYHTDLVDNIDPTDEVIAKLVNAEIMNIQGMEICKEKPLFDKVEYILDHMRRRSTAEFGEFCRILKTCGQEHIVEKYLTVETPVGGVQEVLNLEICQESCRQQPERIDYRNRDKDKFLNVEHTTVKLVDYSQQEQSTIRKYDYSVSEKNLAGNTEMHTTFVATSLGDTQFPVLEVQPTRATEVGSGEPDNSSSVDIQKNHQELKFPTPVSDSHESFETNVELNSTHASTEKQRGLAPLVNHTNEDLIVPEPCLQNKLQSTHNNMLHTAPAWTSVHQPNRPIDIREVHVTQSKNEFYAATKNKSYAMFKQIRGQCIIINIHKVKNAPDRDGTEVDGKLLTALFQQLHFKVTELKNLTARQIKEFMASLARSSSLAEDQCLVLFFLSHGEQVQLNGRVVDSILGTDGERVYADEDILNVFTADSCPQLKSKPKLVFFQACRGVHYDSIDATLIESVDATLTESDGSPPKSYRDFLILYPTQGEFRSFRNTAFGSWYVNAIVRVFMERAHDTGLCHLMNGVNALMSRWTSSTPEKQTSGKTQIAQFHSNFTKEDLYFFPGICLVDEV